MLTRKGLSNIVTPECINKPTSMEEKINKILTRTEGIDQIKTDLKKLKDLAETTREDHGILLDIQAKLDTYRNDSVKLTDEVKKNTDEIKSLKGDITKLEEENNDLKMKLMNQQPNIEAEVNKRVHRSEQRKQLIIEGVPENATENVILTAKQICVDTGVHVQIPDLDNVFRLGKLKEKAARPRNILVQFTRITTRDEVYKNRINIKKKTMCKAIWINENLDPDQRKHRAIMRTVVEYAKEKGKEARLAGDILIVSGLKYSFDRLGALPDEINLTKVFTREDDEFVYFQSEYSSFSSFAPAVINHKGNKFANAEQAFSHSKAKENNKDELAETILKTTDPRRCKQLASITQTTEKWRNMEEQEMADIVTEKFKDPVLRKKLTDTKEKKFVECTRDKRWGADATFRSTQLKTRTWQGGNLLGNILNKEKIRIVREINEGETNAQRDQIVTPVTAAKTPPPKEQAKPKRDKKKSPKERRMERKREQRDLEIAE